MQALCAKLTFKNRSALIEATWCYFVVKCGLSYRTAGVLASTFKCLIPYALPKMIDTEEIVKTFYSVSFGKTKAAQVINNVLCPFVMRDVSLPDLC